MHDDLQQQLYSVQMQLAFLRGSLEAPGALKARSAPEEVDELEQMVQDAIETTRRLSVDLSPPILHEEGLAEGLAWIAARMSEQYRLDVDLQADGSFHLADHGRRVLLFQVVRELLFNAVKHAQVSRVKVFLQQEGQAYRIDVVDEGVGFDPEQLFHDAALPAGQGLVNARERLRLTGGRMEVESAPGMGTRVSIFTPMEGSP